MPLSEYEKRVLDEMERGLSSDDPKLATTMGSRGSRRRGRIVLGVLGILVGLIVLIAGVSTSVIVLGVIGFVLMFCGGLMAISSPSSQGKKKGPGNRSTKPGPKGGPKGKAGLMDRFEERWDRRRGPDA